MTRDGWVGLVLAGLTFVLLLQTRGIPRPALLSIGPGFYPAVVLWTLLGLSLLLLASSLRRSAKEAGTQQKLPKRFPLIVGLFALFGIYTAALPHLGFRVATFGFVTVTQWVLGGRHARGLPRAVLTGVLTSFLTYLIFEVYLKVLLPRGSLVGW
jgi:hypothetical protein